MKKLILLIVAIVCCLELGAQSPNGISYQAVIRDSDGEFIDSSQIGMKISILSGSAQGTPVYVETQTPMTNKQGLITIVIGEGTSNDNLADVNWQNQPFFIKLEVDPDGGTSYSIEMTSQIMSVPFSMYSEYAESAGEVDPIFASSPAFFIQGDDISNWDEAYLWGNHADEGYITDDFEETDPVFISSPAFDIQDEDIENWDEAYQWGNHADGGYLADDFEETDPVFSASAAAGISSSDISNWDNKQDELVGSSEGDMLYWDGNEWVEVPAGNNYQTLTFCEGTPVWTSNGACPDLAVGDYFGGGIVVHIFQPGDPGYVEGEVHGIIASLSDQSTGIEWGCRDVLITGTSSNIGEGQSNTIRISTRCNESNIAANLAGNYALNGYNDWFLPSLNELVILYENKDLIGGFVDDRYWSSSESSATSARFVNFETGATNLVSSKDLSYRVRLIRFF